MPSETSDSQVEFVAVTKRFPLETRQAMLRAALPGVSGQLMADAALDRATFSVGAGEILGIVGRNGAGKTTLLKLSGGILEPTSGSIRVTGIPSSMIELGPSFHPDLTGWENLPIAAALQGINEALLAEIQPEIVAFSGVEHYMHLPVKHFSTGMSARLGFAIAVHAPTPVMLVDEVLAVGDRTFQQACISRVKALASGGASVLFVSHSIDLLHQVCTRMICLDAGRIVDEGPPAAVLARYEQLVFEPSFDGEARPARISSLTLEDQTITAGQMLHVRCKVEVADPSTSMTILSEFKDPSKPAGFSNVDTLPAGTFEQAGSWELSAPIGPVRTTSGKLELTISLLSGTDRKALVDRVSTYFDVLGEDIGAIRLAIDTQWSSVAHSAPPATTTPTVEAPSKGDAVWCEGLSKVFSNRAIESGRATRIRHDSAPLHALSDVSFGTERGEAVGLIGPNGAGKSTLLRVLTGVTSPTSGNFRIAGRVAAVLELGTGFHGDMSGSENLEFTWRLNGGSSEGWEAAKEAIADFADIGPVLDSPTKHYSTGMRARLSIALALELAPDVLVIDEALSVGDIGFRERVRRRILQLVTDGTTLLFASHDLHLLTSICSRVLRFDEGHLVEDGSARSVIANAGGIGWAGGASQGEGGIVLSDLAISPEVLSWNDPFAVEVTLDVARPNPSAYLEFSIRTTPTSDERPPPERSEEMMHWIQHVQRVDAAGPLLSSTGRWVIHGSLAGIPLLNTFDVVVSVVDALGGGVIAEQYRTVYFGADGGEGAQMAVHWQALHSEAPPAATQAL